MQIGSAGIRRYRKSDYDKCMSDIVWNSRR
jgi:hypothetical protein